MCQGVSFHNVKPCERFSFGIFLKFSIVLPHLELYVSQYRFLFDVMCWRDSIFFFFTDHFLNLFAEFSISSLKLNVEMFQNTLLGPPPKGIYVHVFLNYLSLEAFYYMFQNTFSSYFLWYEHTSYIIRDCPSLRPASPHILPIVPDGSTIYTDTKAKTHEVLILLFN